VWWWLLVGKENPTLGSRLRARRVGAVGLRWPTLACVGCCGPTLACVGCCGPTLAYVGLRSVLWVFVGRRWPTLAYVGCCGSSLAYVGCCVGAGCHSNKKDVKKCKKNIYIKKNTYLWARTTRLASFGPVFVRAAHPNPPRALTT
jgi:hypothetical protein